MLHSHRVSVLHLASTSKADLPGFYDPCTGYDNYLEIYYLFKGHLHHVVVSDDDDLHLPMKGIFSFFATLVRGLTNSPQKIGRLDFYSRIYITLRPSIYIFYSVEFSL